MPLTPDTVLRRVLADGATRAARYGEEHAALWAALTEASEGGKRFRPALVLAAHEALGGRSAEAAAQVGAALELLHTAFVVHDDVIDGDEVRRGRPNVSGTFAARAAGAGAAAERAGHLGATAGLLAGDLALAAALRTVATCPAPVVTVRRLLDLFDEALHATAAGELADVELSLALQPDTLPVVLTMEQRKTSAYSFQLPLQAGAILAEAGPEAVAGLGEAGRLLGIAFQLHDDLLGVFGDPQSTGKSATGDLREGKRTVLIAHARGTTAWARLSRLLGRPDLTDAQATEARRLLVEAGSRRFVEDLAEEHLARALAELHRLGMPDSLLVAVSRLTSSALGRAA